MTTYNCKYTSAQGHTMVDDSRYPLPYRSHGGEMRIHTVCLGCGNVSNRLADPDIIITSCDTHGAKVTIDYNTAKTCVQVAREDAHEIAVFTRAGAPELHSEAYHDDNTDCWVCCPDMVIDPYGIFDH